MSHIYSCCSTLNSVNPDMFCGMNLLLRKVTDDHVKNKMVKVIGLLGETSGTQLNTVYIHLQYCTCTALSAKWFVIIFSQLCDLDSIHLVRWTICCFNNPASWISFVLLYIFLYCISTTYRIMNQHRHLGPVSRELTVDTAMVDQELAEWSACILEVWCAKNS